MVVIALKQMPGDTPPHIAMALHDCNFYEGENGFKERMEKQVDFLTEYSGSHNLKIHLVDTKEPPTGAGGDEEPEEEAPDDVVDLTEYPEDSQHAVLAVMRQQGFRGKFRTGPQRQGSANSRAKTPPLTQVHAREQRPAKCGNCGGEHGTRDCTKPPLPPEQRACFNCGGTGHQARDCLEEDRRARPQLKVAPKAKATARRFTAKRAANIVENEADVVWALTVGDDDDEGYRRVGRKPIDLSSCSLSVAKAGISQKEQTPRNDE